MGQLDLRNIYAEEEICLPRDADIRQKFSRDNEGHTDHRGRDCGGDKQ
nr:hypothetical protein [Desulfosporosinus sp.]